MFQEIRNNWPLIIGAAALLSYWSRLTWQTAANVAVATKTLADHAVLHTKHEATQEKLRESEQLLITRIAILEDARTHNADTGKHPVMHARG